MSAVAAGTKLKHPSDSRIYGFDFTRLLASAETLTGTPTVTVSPSGPTASSPAVNVATFPDDEDVSVAIGKGVQLRLAGGTDGRDYLVTVSVGTSLGNTLAAVGNLQVRSK